jgi:hypothetical protein
MKLITVYNGISYQHELDGMLGLADNEILRVAEEVCALGDGALSLFVVDRVNDTVYVRPKVPFGSDPFGFDFTYL